MGLSIAFNVAAMITSRVPNVVTGLLVGSFEVCLLLSSGCCRTGTGNWEQLTFIAALKFSGC